MIDFNTDTKLNIIGFMILSLFIVISVISVKVLDNQEQLRNGILFLDSKIKGDINFNSDKPEPVNDFSKLSEEATNYIIEAGPITATPTWLIDDKEIGRASCRERV